MSKTSSVGSVAQLCALVMSVVGLGCPSAAERAAADQRRTELAAENAKAVAAEPTKADADAAIAAVRTKLTPLWKQHKDGALKAVATCGASSVATKVEPLSVGAFELQQISDTGKVIRLTAYDSLPFFRLFPSEIIRERDYPDVVASGKVVADAKHVVVVQETTMNEPKVDSVAKTYTPGDVKATAVLFEGEKAICKVEAAAALGDSTEVLARDVQPIGNDELVAMDVTSELRHLLVEDVDAKLKAALGENFVGRAHPLPKD